MMLSCPSIVALVLKECNNVETTVGIVIEILRAFSATSAKPIASKGHFRLGRSRVVGHPCHGPFYRETKGFDVNTVE